MDVDMNNEGVKPYKKQKKNRKLDFARYPERRIALLFQYMGWEFDGFVTQPDNERTTEHAIFTALEKVKLIRSIEYAKWSRCGRTDKNVSGFRQVGTCIVRSTDINGEHVYWPEDSTSENRISTTEEFNFVKILNHNLPPGVRILAWAPVDVNFNARYDCRQRSYVYIFPQANFDIEQMRKACKHLEGLHDFRNFCQIDSSSDRINTNYERNIYSAEIELLKLDEQRPVNSMYKLSVTGSGFLWHMIRFIVGLLAEIGSGNEQPELILELMDIEKNPARPSYRMAKDLPLCFFNALYKDDIDWKFDLDALSDVYANLQKIWAELSIKAEQLRLVMNEIETMVRPNNLSGVTKGLTEFVYGTHSPKTYVPVMKRQLCDSLDTRKAKVQKKQTRLDNGDQ